MVEVCGSRCWKGKMQSGNNGSGRSVINEFGFRNNRHGIDALASNLDLGDKVVMKSTENVWMNLYENLEGRRLTVVLANPLKTKAIASARIKSDKVDARILAHLLRSDLVAESYVPSRELREVRALVRHRASIVKMRTMVKNRVHALIDKYGFQCEYSDLFGKRGLEWLRDPQLNPVDELMLDFEE